MFCTKCGKENLEGSQFCKFCGNQLLMANPENISQNQPVPKESIFKKAKTSNALYKIIGFIILIIFIAYGAYYTTSESVINKNNNAIDIMNKTGNYKTAASEFESAANQTNDKNDKINFLKNAAFSYASNSDQNNALAKFREALVLVSDHNSVDYYLISGNIEELQGNANTALYYYNKAYELDPNDFQVNNSLGIFFMGLTDTTLPFQDYNKALLYNKKAYDIDKGDIAAKNLAKNYIDLENYDAALNLLIHTNFQNNASSNYWIGIAYLGKKDINNARTYLQNAVNLGMDVPQEIKDFLNNN